MGRPQLYASRTWAVEVWSAGFGVVRDRQWPESCGTTEIYFAYVGCPPHQ